MSKTEKKLRLKISDLEFNLNMIKKVNSKFLEVIEGLDSANKDKTNRNAVDYNICKVIETMHTSKKIIKMEIVDD